MAYEAYINEAYYTDTYHGTDIDSGNFGRIALRASDEIDRITFRRIRKAGLDSFTESVQEAVMLATCAVAEALSHIDEATDGTGIAVLSEKVGSYSYSTDAASLASVTPAALGKARAYLLSTGLLYAGICP